MLARLVRGLKKDQEGITGLETAIILIAFVMVASVFSYVVLSAGLFSSQKAKQAIQQGLEQSSGTVEVKGNVLAKVVDGIVTDIYLPLATISGGTSTDFTDTSAGENMVVISYYDASNFVTSTNWTLEKISTVNTDNLLDPYELFLVTVHLSGVTSNLTAYHSFSLEVKPPLGAVLLVERTIPARLNEIVNLY
ncbi:MAG: archaellin/type IV pilin N-terminal domain-containing protein [Dehalococcoidales bacterium]|jgi:flagellin FlaB